MTEPRPAPHELVALLTASRRDWKPQAVRQVLTHLDVMGWPWKRILALLPAVAAETDSKPGDVIGAWRPPSEQRATSPTEEYRAVKAELPRGGDPRAHPPG